MPSLFGAIVVDKPSGWTSHDVVARMRRLAATRRIGHLGTLDPMATGVLPLLLGPATRLARFYGGEEKIYEGVIRFGFSTNTCDAEGEATSDAVPFTVDPTIIGDMIVQRFLGEIEQVPPTFSAKKIEGAPAYKLARQNRPVELKPVRVTVHEFRILEAWGERLRARVRCGSGTYVRSLARDLGEAAGVGAHLESLRRHASGPFTLDQAVSLEDAAALAADGRLHEKLIPAADLLPQIPAEVVDDTLARNIREGRDFNASPFLPLGNSPLLKAISRNGELIAIAERKIHRLYHPIIVFTCE
ncbi:MAG: tRNA pseudouridine(55) synthase TruB [Bryobacterales bacterium]|nr:tRNA pseudouridine(55) synthase TruB [Bryobacterales bacterium]